jgi:uncharacterized protein (DUF433 family)
MTLLKPPKPKLKAPAYTGIFSVTDAALFLRATTTPPEVPLETWEKRRSRFVGPNSRHLHEWIKRSSGGSYLTFQELVRMRMIVILRTRGLSLGSILRAERYMRDVMRAPQPFITESLWSSSSDVFCEFGNLIAASRAGQVAMEFLKEYLTPIHHGLSFDRDGLSESWRPLDGILIDPEIQFGAPCIEGTRIETESIWSLYQSGESDERLAELFMIDAKQVSSALQWEELLAKAA